jgi:hypothetical protein
MICRPTPKKLQENPISVVKLSGALNQSKRQFLRMPQKWQTLAHRMAAPLHG